MKSAGLAAAIAGITLLSFFQFPGHTWLQQDTQIYEPILEHLRDPGVLGRDILAERPHVSFTLFDEAALGLRAVTGLDFRRVLALEQLIARGLGVWGVYLMATAMGLTAGPALLAAAILSLGAWVWGPMVLTVEYEPEPRGFATPLLMLALGMAAHGKYLGAGLAGSAAFVMHPPTACPFWGLYGVLALGPGGRRRRRAFIPLAVALAGLLVAARFQAGVGESQVFFSRLAPEQEFLQRLRAPYVWISLWWRDWLPHYLALFASGALAYWRVRDKAPFHLRAFLVGLPLVGMLSMPASWLLLEKLKWALVPQFQPLRALLFVVLVTLLLAVVAGCRAVERGRYLEAFLWFVLAYLAPANVTVAAWPPWNRAAAVALLAAGAVAALRTASGRWAVPALAAMAVAGFFVLPTLGGVENHPRLNTRELAGLSAWARRATPPDAVFLFADAGKGLEPGVFRSEALRAVYVDWKGGGQVNYLRELAEQWWRRWQETGAGRFRADRVPEYAGLDIDYFVLETKNRLRDRVPVFENQRYLVYRLR